MGRQIRNIFPSSWFCRRLRAGWRLGHTHRLLWHAVFLFCKQAKNTVEEVFPKDA